MLARVRCWSNSGSCRILVARLLLILIWRHRIEIKRREQEEKLAKLIVTTSHVWQTLSPPLYKTPLPRGMRKSFGKASRIILQLWLFAVLNPNNRAPSAITTGANGEMSQEIEFAVWSVPQVAKTTMTTARTNTCVHGHRGGRLLGMRRHQKGRDMDVRETLSEIWPTGVHIADIWCSAR